MHHAILEAVKEFFKKYYYVKCLRYTALNFKAILRRTLGTIYNDSGTTHSQLSTKDSVDYILTVLKDYKHISSTKKFSGHVAELGPGDNAGVGLCFVNDGCIQVDLADRFYSHRNMVQQKNIYEALMEKVPHLKVILKGIDLEREETFPKLNRYYGESAAAERFFVKENQYDFIVSRSVLEHVTDPLLALEKMMGALKPKGKLIHKVDLRDHGMFSTSFHELKFLETSTFLYNLMTWNSGCPNRVMFNEYKNCMRKLAFKHDFYITQLAGVGPIEPHLKFEDIDKALVQKALTYIKTHKTNFAKCFQDVRDEDLIVSGFFLVATKSD
jgi:SAM-dependent methyltransferase